MNKDQVQKAELKSVNPCEFLDKHVAGPITNALVSKFKDSGYGRGNWEIDDDANTYCCRFRFTAEKSLINEEQLQKLIRELHPVLTNSKTKISGMPAVGRFGEGAPFDFILSIPVNDPAFLEFLNKDKLEEPIKPIDELIKDFQKSLGDIYKASPELNHNLIKYIGMGMNSNQSAALEQIVAASKTKTSTYAPAMF